MNDNEKIETGGTEVIGNDPLRYAGETSGLGERSSRAITRKARKILRAASVEAPLPNADPIAISKYAALDGDIATSRAECVAHHRVRCEEVLEGRSIVLASLKRSLTKLAQFIESDIDRLRQALASGPFAARIPWTVGDIFRAVLTFVLVSAALPLGYYSIAFFTEQAGILPSSRTWLVAVVGVLFIALLEARLIKRAPASARRKFWERLAVIGSICWVINICCFAWGTRALFMPAILGAASHSDPFADYLAALQMGTQIFAEIITTACLMLTLIELAAEHADDPIRCNLVGQQKRAWREWSIFTVQIAQAEARMAADAYAVQSACFEVGLAFDFQVRSSRSQSNIRAVLKSVADANPSNGNGAAVLGTNGH